MTEVIWGLVLGMVFSVIIIELPFSKSSKFDDAIEQCERESALTENQECVITAKVADKDA